jgi:uncharacterized membrane protein YhaH (DUF805 family)
MKQQRMRRSTFAAYTLAIAFAIILLVGFVTGSRIGSDNEFINMYGNLVYSALIIPFNIKRLHDLNKPGGWVVLQFIPFVGLVFFLYLLFAKGVNENNRFGPDPRID